MKNGKRYFSVSYSVRINGATKRPAVCYALTDDVAAAVESLVQTGKARVYDEEVRFVSGRALPVRRSSVPAPASASMYTPAPIPPAPASVPESVAADPVPVAEPEIPTEAVVEATAPEPTGAGESAPELDMYEEAQGDVVTTPQEDFAATPQDYAAAAEGDGAAGEEPEPARKSSRRTKQPA